MRVEALVFLLVAFAVYYTLNYSWLWFFVLVLVPDVSLLGYLVSKRVGAISYNIGHTYTLPVALIAFGIFVVTSQVAVMFGIVWFVHIAFDRALGLGLKKEDFKTTHLSKAQSQNTELQ